MLTTTAAGRTWNFSHSIGRNAAAGNGFTVYDHGHFAPWKFFITGLVLMSTGAWMVNQAGKSDEYVSMKAAFLTEK